jgi:hypothetical protein
LTKSDNNPPDKPKPLIGGVQHDARGNAVWQWATETARHAVASTSQLLRRLDVSSLSLEDTRPSKTAPPRSTSAKSAPGKPAAAGAAAKPVAPGRSAGGSGFDPYDGAAAARAKPARAAPGHGAPARPRPAAPPAARRSWWRRLFNRR